MALVDCVECGRRISKKAAACPDCGRPVTRPVQTRNVVNLAVAVALLMWLVGVFEPAPPPAKAAAPLTAAQQVERSRLLLLEARALPASAYEDNLAVYSELAKLHPDVALYKEKVAHYQAKVTRQNAIFNQFRVGGGAHIGLENYLKRVLRDPGSYQHVETTYSDGGGDTITVVTTYRAKNGFGGYAVESVTARCTISGECRVLPQ